jgi:FlaA1/EpsC-like NDP-sugar epimerase
MPKDWNQIRDYLMKITPGKRKTFFLLTDVIFIALTVYMSFWLRFDGQIPKEYSEILVRFIVLSEACKVLSLVALKNYNFTWRYFSVGEGIRLISSLFIGWVSLGLLLYLSGPAIIGSVFGIRAFPRSVFIMDFGFSLLLIGLLRISKRAFREYGIRRNHAFKGKARTLIIGAGAAGEQIGREMMRNAKSKYFPVGYLDDDPAKLGVIIHGIKVIGQRKDISEVVKANHIDEILIAMPTAPSKEIREIVTLIRNADSGKNIKILPSIIDLMEGNAALKDIQEVKVEDLLGREPVKIDYAVIRNFISGKRVLITGAGGSIGSELTRTVQQFGPAKLGVLDNDETELYYVTNRLKIAGGFISPYIADIRDAGKIESVFAGFRPEIVIHAAAYKHVPILEHCPEEAVKTNISGTRILGELANKFGVSKFVNISTDKAINPTSVMGTSKRIGEEILQVLNRKNGTRFISVRFGNVLGSRGSVIPLFKEQILRGGPVTVTHREMKRYFMATSEAVLLVLEAAAYGEGGEVFVLDMGEPIMIDDLAREMIRLSGHEPDVDIAVVYSGLRPGEKLFEELLGSQEDSEATEHPKIFKAKTRKNGTESILWESVDRLAAICGSCCKREDIIELLKSIVPTYKPDMGNGSILNW